jgi:hypothetical protein
MALSSSSSANFESMVPEVSFCSDISMIFKNRNRRGLLTSELETIFARAPLAPNDVTNPRVREAYDRALDRPSTSTAPAAAPESSARKKRIPGPEDDCPVCYDGMEGVAEASLVFCDECGNALHQECFAQCRFFDRHFSLLLTP